MRAPKVSRNFSAARSVTASSRTHCPRSRTSSDCASRICSISSSVSSVSPTATRQRKETIAPSPTPEPFRSPGSSSTSCGRTEVFCFVQSRGSSTVTPASSSAGVSRARNSEASAVVSSQSTPVSSTAAPRTVGARRITAAEASAAPAVVRSPTARRSATGCTVPSRSRRHVCSGQAVPTGGGNRRTTTSLSREPSFTPGRAEST